jgi:hypothetical protein
LQVFKDKGNAAFDAEGYLQVLDDSNFALLEQPAQDRKKRPRLVKLFQTTHSKFANR